MSISIKEQVLLAIQRLPEEAGFRDAAEEIAFLKAMRKAENDIAENRLISNEQMKTRIVGWSAK